MFALHGDWLLSPLVKHRTASLTAFAPNLCLAIHYYRPSVQRNEGRAVAPCQTPDSPNSLGMQMSDGRQLSWTFDRNITH